MRLHDHRQLRAFLAAIAPLGLSAVGCADLGEFEGRVCVYEPDALRDLDPRDGVDYVGLRSLDSFTDPPSASVTSEWGVACDTAGDAEACLAALAALAVDGDPLWGQSGGFDWGSAHDVVFTAGDETGRITDVGALVELLGPIDTPHEALLMAHANGHEVTCSEANWRENPGGYTLRGTRGEWCGGEGEWHYEVIVASDGTVTKGEEVEEKAGDPNCAVGRRPEGLCSRTRMARQLGDFFANASHLEAASVPAFGQLARELAAHGAPRNLVRAAWRARREEIRHARATAALARRFGAAPIRPRVQPRPIRSLFAMALDNATEGCVRETFGAAAAAVQARSASDLAVRRAMRSIASDEASHATLSWAIDAWAKTKLSPTARRAMRAARDETVAELHDETMHRWSPAIRQRAGMPGIDAAMRMLEPMVAGMWQA